MYKTHTLTQTKHSSQQFTHTRTREDLSHSVWSFAVQDGKRQTSAYCWMHNIYAAEECFALARMANTQAHTHTRSLRVPFLYGCVDCVRRFWALWGVLCVCGRGHYVLSWEWRRHAENRVHRQVQSGLATAVLAATGARLFLLLLFALIGGTEWRFLCVARSVGRSPQPLSCRGKRRRRRCFKGVKELLYSVLCVWHESCESIEMNVWRVIHREHTEEMWRANAEHLLARSTNTQTITKLSPFIQATSLTISTLHYR